jgi:flavin-binding protein dodecin
MAAAMPEPVEVQSSLVYANTLSALTKARDSMLTLEWHEELNEATPQQQRDAARTLLRLENAIMALSNARLSEIAQKMSASQKELKAATEGIEEAEQTLANIVGFLNAAAELVAVVAKVVTLV